MDKPTVLYIAHATANHGGATLSLYNLINSLKGKVNPIVICHDEGPIVEKMRNDGIRCIVLPFYMLWEYKKGLQYYLNLPRIYWKYRQIEKESVKKAIDLLNDTKIDLVHSNSSIFTFGHSIAKTLKCKHIWHIREFLDLDFNIEVLFGRNRLKRIINNADARINISNAICHHWKLKIDNTYIIGDAVRKTSPNFQSQTRENYILFCAAYLTPQKGTELCINAYAKSKIYEQGIKLKLYGRCPDNYKIKLTELIKKHNIEKHVEINDFCEDIDTEFKKAKTYIMASENEALGRVTIEAMFNGCPVIGKATGGTLDIVKDNVTGYLFNTEDECATLINKVINNDNTQITQKAFDYVCQNFSEENYGIKIMEVYNSLLTQ